MKATWIWRTGPSQGREVSLDKIRRVEMGGAGPGRLEVPGCPAGQTWAVLDVDKGRCYLSNASAPVPVTITRKVSGQVQTTAVEPGQRVETKMHDVITFGPDGPAVYAQYEIEAADRFGAGFEDLPEAVSPLSADRHRMEAQAKSVAGKQDLEEVQKRADRAAAAATTAQTEGRRSGRRLAQLAVLVVIGGAALTLFLVSRLRDAEAALNTRLFDLRETISKESQDSLQANRKMLESSREEARAELVRLQEEHDRLAGGREQDQARLEELRGQIGACQIDLQQNVPLEKKFAAMQESVDEALFLIGTWVKVSRPIWDDGRGGAMDSTWCTGTGFVIDADGHLVTAKHVVHPWKYLPMSETLARCGVSVVDYAVVAYPVGYRFPPPGGTSSDPSYRAELLAVPPDNLVTYNAGTDARGAAVTCHIEGSWESDVALLRIDAPVTRPLRLAEPSDIAVLQHKKLWPVMVAGFPLGLQILERATAESSMTLGTVRKFEKILQHTAPTCGGNSGGPVIDEQGRVVGIVSHANVQQNVQNLNGAVSAAEVARLLEALR